MFVPLLAEANTGLIILVWILGGFFGFACFIASLLVRSTAGNRRPGTAEWTRRAGLAVLALVSGPVLGAAWSTMAIATGSILPVDTAWAYPIGLMVGGLDGLITATAFALTSIFAPRIAGKKDGSGSWIEL